MRKKAWGLGGLFFLAVLLSCSRPHPDIAQSLMDIAEDSVMQHVEALCSIGPRHALNEEACELALNYIEGTLRALGYVPRREVFQAEGKEMVNVFVEIEGEDPGREKILELAAHYDTRPSTPGADDNASGVAGVLEAARVLRRFRYRKTVRFCFFTGEELGLLGSRYHVRQIRKKGEDVQGIIVLEMIGYATEEPNSQLTPVRIPLILSPPDVGNFIVVVGNWSSGGLGNRFESAIDRYVPELDYFSLNRLGGFLKDAVRSDHYPYWEADLKGLMITDTANFRNPHYHRPSDTPETLDPLFLRNVARAAAATMMEWAEVL